MHFKLNAKLREQIRVAMQDVRHRYVIDCHSNTVKVVANCRCALTDSLVQTNDCYNLPKWSSTDGYHVMQAFTNAMTGGILKVRLLEALAGGSGAYKRFKFVLNSDDKLKQKFLRYKTNCLDKAIGQWYTMLLAQWQQELTDVTDDSIAEDDEQLLALDFRFSGLVPDIDSVAKLAEEAESQSPCTQELEHVASDTQSCDMLCNQAVGESKGLGTASFVCSIVNKLLARQLSFVTRYVQALTACDIVAGYVAVAFVDEGVATKVQLQAKDADFAVRQQGDDCEDDIARQAVAQQHKQKLPAGVRVYEALITGLYVYPEYRGLGLVKGLLSACGDELKECGVKYLSVCATLVPPYMMGLLEELCFKSEQGLYRKNLVA